MIRISATEFRRNFARYQDRAMIEPVTVTRRNGERTVLMSLDEYQRLTLARREVLRPEDLSDDDLAAIASATPPVEAATFDSEVDG